MIERRTGASIDVLDHLITVEKAKRRSAIVAWQDAQLDLDLKQENVIYLD
jgi:hypothetical protein